MSRNYCLRKGWSHFGCGPWRIMGRIPSRWRKVREGVAMPGDRAVTLTPEGERLSKLRRRGPTNYFDMDLPATWMDVRPENMGNPAKNFACLIRRAKPHNTEGLRHE